MFCVVIWCLLLPVLTFIISVSCVLVSAWARLIHVDSGLCLEAGSTVLQECGDECSDGQVSNSLIPEVSQVMVLYCLTVGGLSKSRLLTEL